MICIHYIIQIISCRLKHSSSHTIFSHREHKVSRIEGRERERGEGERVRPVALQLLCETWEIDVIREGVNTKIDTDRVAKGYWANGPSLRLIKTPIFRLGGLYLINGARLVLPEPDPGETNSPSCVTSDLGVLFPAGKTLHGRFLTGYFTMIFTLSSFKTIHIWIYFFFRYKQDNKYTIRSKSEC